MPSRLAVFLLAARVFAASAPIVGLDRNLAELPNLVIHETVDRYVGAENRSRKVDTLATMVEVIGGREKNTGIWRNGRSLYGPREAGGLWSFGEIATLLEVTQDALRNMPSKPGGQPGDDGPDLYFQFPASSRRWYVEVDSRIWWLEFEGRVILSPDSGEITRILWTSSPLPRETGLGRVHWTVDFLPVAVAGRMLTLPAQAVYRVTRAGRGNRAEWNITTFSRYERYGSSTTMSFETDPAESDK